MELQQGDEMDEEEEKEKKIKSQPQCKPFWNRNIVSKQTAQIHMNVKLFSLFVKIMLLGTNLIIQIQNQYLKAYD